VLELYSARTSNTLERFGVPLNRLVRRIKMSFLNPPAANKVQYEKSRVTMLKKEDATEIRDHALTAIKELMTLFHFAKDKCSPEQHEQIKRGVGLAIGNIQMEILEVINQAYPEFDDLIEPIADGQVLGNDAVS
jgi:hypothetical protein